MSDLESRGLESELDPDPESELEAQQQAADRNLESAGAFLAALEPHRVAVFRFLSRLCREEAEDLAQETFKRAFEARNQLRGDAKAWLFTIALNAAHGHRTRVKGRSVLSDEFSLDPETALDPYSLGLAKGWTVGQGPDRPDEALRRTEMQAQLNNAFESLAESDRQLVMMIYIDELPRPKAAEKLDISYDALRQRLHRAREVMKESLERYAKENL
ncbi:MAG: RNA polymerase sigma factor [Deltaproteobacteria bacterium]|nr:RNA polymerase sigma factor [Deltaproteobacteria bacterium]